MQVGISLVGWRNPRVKISRFGFLLDYGKVLCFPCVPFQGGVLGGLFDPEESRYILSYRCLDLSLDPCIALGTFISKGGIQDNLLISILRIAQSARGPHGVGSYVHFFHFILHNSLAFIYVPVTSVLVNEHNRYMCPNLRSVFPSRK